MCPGRASSFPVASGQLGAETYKSVTGAPGGVLQADLGGEEGGVLTLNCPGGAWQSSDCSPWSGQSWGTCRHPAAGTPNDGLWLGGGLGAQRDLLPCLVRGVELPTGEPSEGGLGTNVLWGDILHNQCGWWEHFVAGVQKGSSCPRTCAFFRPNQMTASPNQPRLPGPF